jgi:NADPH:quinone reductase
LVEQVTNDKGRSVVLTAAASQLCKMMIRIFNEKNITVIATIRKEEQEKDLKSNFGLEHVLNITDDDFLDKFKETTKQLNCKHILECVGGDIFGKLVSRMPKETTAILYGNLSRANTFQVEPFTLMTNDVKIRGFLLNVWLMKKGLLSILMIIRKVKKMIRENLSTEIQKEFDLKDYKEAKECYEANMSAGKVILKPWGLDE